MYNCRCMSMTLVEEEVAVTAPAETPAKPPEETIEEIKKRSSKPPSDGKCRRCGEPKPVNRLKLCYKCWVESVLEDRGWVPGTPHPADCGCEGLGEHTSGGGGSPGAN